MDHNVINIKYRPQLIDDNIIQEVIHNSQQPNNNGLLIRITNKIMTNFYTFIENHIFAVIIVALVILFLSYRFIKHFFDTPISKPINKESFKNILYKHFIKKSKHKPKFKIPITEKIELKKQLSEQKQIEGLNNKIPTRNNLAIINSAAYAPSNLQDTFNYHSNIF